jgi:hypothetical protein
MLSMVLVAVGATGCTAGEVVDDKTNAPISKIFVKFHDVDLDKDYIVQASTTGEFGFDQELTQNGANTVAVGLPQGNYTVETGNLACGTSIEDLFFDHFTTEPFHHTYDTTCNGSAGTSEQCEFYQIRVSALAIESFAMGPPAEPTSDDHTGDRVITVYTSLATPQQVPCN